MAVLQVRQEPAPGFVVGVGNIVPDHGLLARNVAHACHEDTPILFFNGRWRVSVGTCGRLFMPSGQTPGKTWVGARPHLAKRVAVTRYAKSARRPRWTPDSAMGAARLSQWQARFSKAADCSRGGPLVDQFRACSRKRCASSAAMQPVPALVMAWRYTWSCTSPAANTPGTLVCVAMPLRPPWVMR